MSLLRLYCPLSEAPGPCDWSLLGNGRPSSGRSALTDLPRQAERVQLIVPAAEVFITRARLPSASRMEESVLAFAVEEQVVGDPAAVHVSHLGTAGAESVLAVFDRAGLERWRAGLESAGIHRYEVHSEMLLLPWATDEWALAWNGREGFVRTGPLEAATTDIGDRHAPPLALRTLVDAAAAEGRLPLAMTLHPTAEDAIPDLEAWQRELGMPIRVAGLWSWRTSDVEGTRLLRETTRWRALPAILPRLRFAAWVAGIALALHAVALAVDWAVLAAQQRSLRQEMNERFRATFPDAVAVVDPVLQMRRKLTEARHAAGQPDAGDFIPLVNGVSDAMRELPVGAVRIVSYEQARMTLELVAVDERTMQRMATRLRQTGLGVEGLASAASAGRQVITVRAE